MADLLSPENVDVDSYLRGVDRQQKSRGIARENTNNQQAQRNSNLFPEHSGTSGPAPDLTWKKVQAVPAHNNRASNTLSNVYVHNAGTSSSHSSNMQQQQNQQNQESLTSELSEEQIDWLDQMVQLYGAAFERDQWIESFKAQNAEASANYLASIGQAQSGPTSVQGASSTTPVTMREATAVSTKSTDSGRYLTMSYQHVGPFSTSSKNMCTISRYLI